MMEVTDQEKIEGLEKILKSLTYADEIRYKKFDESFWIMELVRADPNRFEYIWDLDIVWDAEPYTSYPPEHMQDEFLPTPSAKMVASVWISQDVWEIIEDLKAEVQSLKGRGDEEAEDEKEWLTCSDCTHAHDGRDIENPLSPCYKSDEDEAKFGDECSNFIRKEVSG